MLICWFLGVWPLYKSLVYLLNYLQYVTLTHYRLSKISQSCHTIQTPFPVIKVRIIIFSLIYIYLSRAVSIRRVPIFRISTSSEPMHFSQGRYFAGCRIQMKCVSLCAHVPFRHYCTSFCGPQ